VDFHHLLLAGFDRRTKTQGFRIFRKIWPQQERSDLAASRETACLEVFVDGEPATLSPRFRPHAEMLMMTGTSGG
jgi:hypothetical protein